MKQQMKIYRCDLKKAPEIQRPLYEEGDSNSHALRTPDPKSGASTNSAILAKMSG